MRTCSDSCSPSSAWLAGQTAALTEATEWSKWLMEEDQGGRGICKRRIGGEGGVATGFEASVVVEEVPCAIRRAICMRAFRYV